MSRIQRESGAVSIFVVIFAALLITIVTVSFIRIMINDQNQATNNDLSQSAYDSAQAGIEDAKRALLRYVSFCRTNTSGECEALRQVIDSESCNVSVRTLEDPNVSANADIGEIRVQQTTSSTDDVLDQAYTCVRIDLDTDDYTAPIALNESKLIPLKGVGPFSTVSIEWFSAADVQAATGGTTLVVPPTSANNQPLLGQGNWPASRPPVVRAQLMQVAGSFTLSSFDYMAAGQSNANTVFLYPTRDGNTQTTFAGRDSRRTTPTGVTPQDGLDTPLPTRCEQNMANFQYACKIELQLPAAIGSASEADRLAYLRLTPFYKASNVRIKLYNSAGTLVQFQGVQPSIDSTGRANELFRRVEARVDMIDTDFPYPDAALDVSGNLCKNFAVTNTTYSAGSPACTP